MTQSFIYDYVVRLADNINDHDLVKDWPLYATYKQGNSPEKMFVFRNLSELRQELTESIAIDVENELAEGTTKSLKIKIIVEYDEQDS